MAETKHILALGGGRLADGGGVDDFALALCGADRPRVCLLPTASGDADDELDAFYAVFDADRAVASHIGLFRRKHENLAKRLQGVDALYIGGGNVANLLALWRLHGLDRLVGDAYRAGTVVVGLSAGASCLFEACLTDSFGTLAPMADGLGLLSGSFCPHYDNPKRRPRYRELVRDGFAPGYGVDGGAALHFVDGALVEALSVRQDAVAYRVTADQEERLPTRELEDR